jgi:hypothetical protein
MVGVPDGRAECLVDGRPPCAVVEYRGIDVEKHPHRPATRHDRGRQLLPVQAEPRRQKIAKALAKIEAQLINPTTVTSPTTATTATSATSPTDQAQQLTPSVVPEPTTLFLTFGMAGYAVWRRRRRD